MISSRHRSRTDAYVPCSYRCLWVAIMTSRVELISCAIHQDARKGAILLCTDNLLSGNCNLRVREFGECQTLAGDKALDNAISSGRADECSLCAGKS